MTSPRKLTKQQRLWKNRLDELRQKYLIVKAKEKKSELDEIEMEVFEYMDCSEWHLHSSPFEIFKRIRLGVKL